VFDSVDFCSLPTSCHSLVTNQNWAPGHATYPVCSFQVLHAGEEAIGVEQLDEDMDDITRNRFTRRNANMSSMSGADGRLYMEYRSVINFPLVSMWILSLAFSNMCYIWFCYENIYLVLISTVCFFVHGNNNFWYPRVKGMLMNVMYSCAVRAVEEEWEGVVNPNSVTPTNLETNFSRSVLPRDTSSSSMYYIFRQDFIQHLECNKNLM
jgi:hypothetical protein